MFSFSIRLPSDQLWFTEGFLEPMTGGVQSPLDRPHRTVESVTHLLQGLPLEVECQECFPIERPELLESQPNLISAFPLQDAINRGRTGHTGKRFWSLNRFLRPTNGAIDRHPDRDSLQPSDEPFRFSELIELPQRPHEDFLRHFDCFRLVPQASKAD